MLLRMSSEPRDQGRDLKPVSGGYLTPDRQFRPARNDARPSMEMTRDAEELGLYD